MNITDYKQLDLNNRAFILCEKGNFVEDRYQYGKYKIAIFRLFDFYVEVFYDVSGKIERIQPLENETDWERYTDSISLEYLMG